MDKTATSKDKMYCIGLDGISDVLMVYQKLIDCEKQETNDSFIVEDGPLGRKLYNNYEDCIGIPLRCLSGVIMGPVEYRAVTLKETFDEMKEDFGDDSSII